MWKTDISVWFDKPNIIQAFSDDGEEQDYMPERMCKVAACYSPSDLSSEDEWYFAFSCGCELYWDEATPPKYCPNCGARVVTCRNTSDSNYFHCSVCQKKTYRGEETFNYCPSCGAKVVD